MLEHDAIKVPVDRVKQAMQTRLFSRRLLPSVHPPDLALCAEDPRRYFLLYPHPHPELANLASALLWLLVEKGEIPAVWKVERQGSAVEVVFEIRTGDLYVLRDWSVPALNTR